MRLLALIIVLLTTTTATAQDSHLQTLSTLDTSRGWQAVGRLNIGAHSFCTATLIAPDKVLTAAHCLFDRATGARIPREQMVFLAGWRTGRAEATRGISAVAIEPGFHFTQGETLERVASDLALLQLDQPIRLPSVLPFAVDTATPAAGAPVAVVSYARDRSEAPSLQDRCAVLDQRRDGVMVLSCAIDFGASGAPVFTLHGGQVRIVSVLSAMASSSGQTVALGMRLEGRLAALEAALGEAPAGARESARFLRSDPS
ncbi:trypsin-like serine peptidase [Pararhodobacter sp.]|uniref:trypsin-like serine peptidase n=1 Tax=Pararhodobacter sp. TaxID=2127056 RepID=UPI002FDD8CB5